MTVIAGYIVTVPVTPPLALAVPVVAVKKWNVQPGTTYEADMQIIRPMIRASAQKYAGEKKLTQRDCAKEAN